MNIVALRALMRPVVGDLKGSCTNTEMPEFCQKLGLPIPDNGGDKRGRLHKAFDALNDTDLPRFAHTLLERRILNKDVRNQIQDLLWEEEVTVEIPKRHRRELAKALQPLRLFCHWGSFKRLIEDFCIIPVHYSELLLGHGNSTLAEIQRRFAPHSQEADVEWLFDKLQAVDLSAPRFRRWIEGLVSADVQHDRETQLSLVNAMNTVFKTCNAELRHISEAEGYPVFSLVSLRQVQGRPKNIIFASSTKPDIRFVDSLDNHIEILSPLEEVLVYDRPLSAEGLSWRELQSWWADLNHEEDSEQAKKTLYRRLKKSLPNSSPPQQKFFDAFFRQFRQAVHELPALLPEVWLHWDPKTIRERGAQALLTHRMDFLMLLPAGGRVVIEIDGIQHYADKDNKASTNKYAQLVEGDRRLKLAGYDVYRFAGTELLGNDASTKVKAFFEVLFKRHGIKTNPHDQ